MSEPTAFAPKEAFRDPDSLGSVFVADDVEVNVRELVEQSGREDGAFLVHDPRVVARLDAYPAVKRVAASHLLGTEEDPQESGDQPEGQQPDADISSRGARRAGKGS
jgi:hypothetical protein